MSTPDTSTGGTDKRAFPPGSGWIPLTLAVIAAIAVSSFSLKPAFDDKIVGLKGGGNQATSQGGDTTGQGTSTTGAGTSTSTTTGPGAHQGGGTSSQADCAKGQNGGATAPGVTSHEIVVTTTKVTTGVGRSFLQEATNGIQAALNEVNAAGGICGRQVLLGKQEDNTKPLNTGWDAQTGGTIIDQYIHTGKVFALVGEPDSEGLEGALAAGTIDRNGIPVVGTDGMLKDQYKDPWVYPVASSTISNMHIAAKYAVDHNLKSVGIVFDKRYHFGKEGAQALDAELKRLGRSDIPGYDPSLNGCQQAFCGIDSDQSSGGFQSEMATFDQACAPCDLVVALLEPGPMQTWMKGEYGQSYQHPWYNTLMGGEPLFDDTFANNCEGCAGEQTKPALMVWTGYHPPIQPFDSEKAVYTYKQSLLSVCPSCDPNNEFTEGAYLGTRLFIEAAKRVGPNLTRDALKQVLDTQSFDLGLTAPLAFGGSLHISNSSMALFQENATGNTFEGWKYQVSNPTFLADPARGQDIN